MDALSAINSYILFLVMVFPLFSAIFSIVKLIVTKRDDVIDTSENTIKICLALFVHFVYFFFLFQLIITASVTKDEPLGNVIVIILVGIFPSISLILNYLFLDRFLKAEFKIKELKTQSRTIEEMKKNAEQILKKLELNIKLDVIFSGCKGISPFVFGKTKHVCLVLPSNWNEILNEVCKGDKRLKQNLRDFLIFHELSHVKHKDHVFISTSHLFLKSFKYWVSGLFLFIVYLLITGITDITFKFIFHLFFGMFYYFFTFLITMSVSKNREFLADARAALFISEEKLQAIIAENQIFKGQRISSLEALLSWFSLSSKRKTRTIGIASPNSNYLINFIKNFLNRTKDQNFLAKIIKKFQSAISSHPEKEERRLKIIDKSFIGRTDYTISKGTAIWLGIILSIFTITPLLFPNEVKDIVFSTTFTWGSIKFTTRTAFFVFMIIITSLISAYPLNNSTSLEVPFKVYLTSIIKKYSIMFISYCLTGQVLIMVPMLLMDPSFNVSTLIFSIKWLLVCSIFALYIFLVSFLITIFLRILRSALATKFLFDEIQKDIWTSALIFLTVICLWFFLISLLRLTISSILFGVSIGMSVCIYLGRKFLFLYDNSQMFYVFGNNKFVIIGDSKRALRLFFGSAAVVFCIVVSVIAILGEGITPPIKYLISSAFVILFLIMSKFLFLSRLLNFQSSVFLYFVYFYLSTLKILNFPKLLNIKEMIRNDIKSLRLEDGSFAINKVLNIGSSEVSYCALFSLAAVGTRIEEEYATSADWFLGLEDKCGGFFPVMGLKPRLLSTFIALSILQKFNMVKKCCIDTHVNWLTKLQDKDGFFCDLISRISKLEQTYYALSVLSILGGLGKIKQKDCAEWIYEKWRTTKKNPKFVFFSVKSLIILGQFDEVVKEEVRNWMPSYGTLINSLDIDRSGSIIYYFYKIAEIILDDKEELKGLIPGLDEKIYNNFLKYWEKR